MNNFYCAAQKGIRKTNTKWKEDAKNRNYVKNLYEKEFEELNVSVCHNFLMELWGLSIENWNVEENKYLFENCQISWVAIEVFAWNTLTLDFTSLLYPLTDKILAVLKSLSIYLYFLIEFRLSIILKFDLKWKFIYKNQKFMNRKFNKKLEKRHQRRNSLNEIFYFHKLRFSFFRLDHYRSKFILANLSINKTRVCIKI